MAEANNCLLTVEEMGFGSDMKHLSGFDPNLHCCFCQKLGLILNLLPISIYLKKFTVNYLIKISFSSLSFIISVNDCIDNTDCASFQTCREQFVAWTDKGEVFGPSFCDPVIGMILQF